MSIFSKVVSFFSKLWKSSPTWSQQVSTGVKLAAPFVEAIIALLAGAPAAEEAQKIIAEIQCDLTAIATLAASAHGGDTSTVAQINRLLASVSNDAGALLAGGHIKDPALVTEIETAVKLLTGEVAAITSALPTAA